MAKKSTGKLKKAAQKAKAAPKKSAKAKSAKSKASASKVSPKSAKPKSNGKTAGQSILDKLRLIERRRHPRFLLSGEQFKESKTRRIFSVYDLSSTGFSVKVDEKYWAEGEVVSGVLNLHPESIEVAGRVVGYHGDRAALRFEIMSTYARSSLARSLSPARLGKSLALVREKLPMADYWFHGVCNTDVLIKLDGEGRLVKLEVFFANYYWSWSEVQGVSTGICQSFGKEKLESVLMSIEPVTLESLDLVYDSKVDAQKANFARAIIDAAPLEMNLKRTVTGVFEAALQPAE